MVSWNTYNFECEDVAAREALMDWFEENHPVEFPDDRYSVFADIETEDGTTGADYAWLDRYLYVTVMGDAEAVVFETIDRWNRAALVSFDGSTETATDVMLVVETDAGEDDEVGAVQFEGVEGFGGNDVMYALGMAHEFRFRSYSAQSPTSQITPHPDAFDVVADLDEFVENMTEVTGVEATEAGLALFRNDPADDDRYQYGETYGPVDSDTDDGVDAVTVVDAETGESETYEESATVPDEDDGFLERISGLLRR